MISCSVETPAFAVMRTIQQALDNLFISVLGRIVQERAQLLTRRGQADQIEIDATQERVLFRRPSFSCSAAMKVSMGFFDQAAFLTFGKADRTGV